MSNTGVLSGKATVAAASTTHTLTVTDNFGRTVTGTFDLTVSIPAALSVTIPTASFDVTVGAALNITPVVAADGEGEHVFSLDASSAALPDGVTLDPATGQISGTVAATQPPGRSTTCTRWRCSACSTLVQACSGVASTT